MELALPASVALAPNLGPGVQPLGQPWCSHLETNSQGLGGFSEGALAYFPQRTVTTTNQASAFPFRMLPLPTGST